MPAMPRTRTARRQVARAMRATLSVHISQLSEETTRRPLDIVQDAVILARLEGYPDDSIRAIVEQSLRVGRSAS